MPSCDIAKQGVWGFLRGSGVPPPADWGGVGSTLRSPTPNAVFRVVTDGFVVWAASVAPSREVYETVSADFVRSLGHVLRRC